MDEHPGCEEVVPGSYRVNAFFPRDEYFMRLALREAERALEHDDVPVGCTIVLDGEVIAATRNERELRGDPTAHAEVLALREASKRLGEDVEDRAGGAGLGVGRAEDDPRRAGEDDRPRAHRARLERHVEHGVEPVSYTHLTLPTTPYV